MASLSPTADAALRRSRTASIFWSRRSISLSRLRSVSTRCRLADWFGVEVSATCTLGTGIVSGRILRRPLARLLRHADQEP